VLMGASTFWTQRQLMARNRASGSGTDQMAQQQKIMLYVLPLTFAVFGYRFPLGVLLYWLTTNLWSMGQQHFVIARMDAKDAAAKASTDSSAPAGPPPGARPARAQPSTEGPSTAAAPPPPRPNTNRRPSNASRKNRNRRGRR
jgi:YidC/Oxa1 family membrane protein insertase